MFKHNIEWGKNAELKFEDCLVRDKIPYHKSSPYEDKYLHIDYFAKIGKTKKSIDVKALKKIRGRLQDDFFYIELINDYGNKGWIYAHKLDVLAFECFTTFELYKRKKLLDYIQSKGVDSFKCITRTLPQINFTSKCILIPRNELNNIRFATIKKNMELN